MNAEPSQSLYRLGIVAPAKASRSIHRTIHLPRPTANTVNASQYRNTDFHESCLSSGLVEEASCETSPERGCARLNFGFHPHQWLFHLAFCSPACGEASWGKPYNSHLISATMKRIRTMAVGSVKNQTPLYIPAFGTHVPTPRSHIYIAFDDPR